MGRKVVLGFVSLVVLIIPLFSSTTSNRVNAEALLQETPRLDGYQIYFSEALNEANRFDRTQAGISRFAGLLYRLGAELHTLNWNVDFPPEVDLLVIAGPTSDLSGEQSARLWNYVNNGGRVLLIVEPTAIDGRSGQLRQNDAFRSQRGFFELTWKDLGINARDDVVVTEGEIRTVYPPPGRIRENEPTPTPRPPVQTPILISDLVTTNVNSTHPITQNINGELAFSGTKSIEIDAAIQPFEATPLVFSGESFYGETDYGRYLSESIAEYNIGSDIARGPLILVAAVENPEDGARMVLFGDRDFIINGGGFRTSPSFSAGFLYPENVRLMLSAVVWLLDANQENTVELVFPTPGPTATVTTTPTPLPTNTPEPTATPEGSSQ